MVAKNRIEMWRNIAREGASAHRQRTVWREAGDAMDEAGDHGSESVAAVVALGAAGGAAFGVVGSELTTGSGERALDVSGRGVDPLEGRHAHTGAPGTRANRAMVLAGMAEGGPGFSDDCPADDDAVPGSAWASLPSGRSRTRRAPSRPGSTCASHRGGDRPADRQFRAGCDRMTSVTPMPAMPSCPVRTCS